MPAPGTVLVEYGTWYQSGESHPLPVTSTHLYTVLPNHRDQCS